MFKTRTDVNSVDTLYFYRVVMDGSAGETEKEDAVNVETSNDVTTTKQRGGDESSSVQGVDDSSKLGDGCEATPSAGSSERILLLLMDYSRF